MSVTRRLQPTSQEMCFWSIEYGSGGQDLAASWLDGVYVKALTTISLFLREFFFHFC